MSVLSIAAKTQPAARRSLPPDALHRTLNELNRRRMTPTYDAAAWGDALESEYALRRLELAFIERERQTIAARAAEAPLDADGFVRWFEGLRETGPGQGDPLFPWLEQHASLEQVKWFLEQEMAGEAGFDDLVALTQVKLPARAKLEMARNYWDEMGQGSAPGMHGPMLEGLARALELTPRVETTVWQSLALANLMCGLANNRCYAYQSVGALGVIELTAPGRSACVNVGLKRLGMSGSARRYYALHATLDIKHADAWQREVLHTLVSAEPQCATAIAEGALMRLTAGERCFTRYRRELWG